MKTKLFVFLLCGILALSLSGCGNDSSDDTSQSESNSSNSIEENISIVESSQSESGKLVAIVKNSNDEPVYVEVKVVFYDEEGNTLNSETAYMSISSNSEMSYYFYNTPSDYDTYEFTFDAETDYYENYTNQFDITDTDTGEQITVQTTNNSSETVDYVDVAIVYYRDGVIVGYDEDFYYDLEAGQTATFTLYYPFDADYEEVEYDDYKVFFSAYNFTV